MKKCKNDNNFLHVSEFNKVSHMHVEFNASVWKPVKLFTDTWEDSVEISSYLPSLSPSLCQIQASDKSHSCASAGFVYTSTSVLNHKFKFAFLVSDVLSG